MYGDQLPIYFVPRLSAFYAMAMIALGADGDTLYEFENLLGASPNEIIDILFLITESFSELEGSTDLKIANSMWICDEFRISNSVIETLKEKFDTLVSHSNFASQTAVENINEWVYEQTQGLIEEIIQHIPEEAVLIF